MEKFTKTEQYLVGAMANDISQQMRRYRDTLIKIGEGELPDRIDRQIESWDMQICGFIE